MKRKEIYIGFKSSAWFCLKNFFCGYSKSCCNSKLYLLYLTGRTQVESEMDILKMMRRLRHHDVTMKSSMLSSQERKLQAKYARKYALEVDSQIDSELE